MLKAQIASNKINSILRNVKEQGTFHLSCAPIFSLQGNIGTESRYYTEKRDNWATPRAQKGNRYRHRYRFEFS